jgi:hypothetical protein
MCSPVGYQRNSNIAALFRRGKVEAHCFSLQAQAFRRFIAAEQQSRFAGARGGQELETEGGLTRSRGANHGAHGGHGQATTKHHVERSNTGRDPGQTRWRAPRRHGELGLDPREKR